MSAQLTLPYCIPIASQVVLRGLFRLSMPVLRLSPQSGMFIMGPAICHPALTGEEEFEWVS